MKISRLFLLAGVIAVSIFFLFETHLGGINTDSGRIAVITRYYGITAEEIEQIITIPFEQSFSSIAGIEELNAYSEFSLSRIDMKIDVDADHDEIISQLRERTDRIYAVISAEYQAVQKPQFVTSGSDQQSVFSAAISLSGMTAEELRPVVENRIKPEYSRIPGIGEIDITGGAIREIHVYIDTDKAAAYGYHSSSIASVIQASNIYAPCGSLEVGPIRIPVSLDARITDLEKLRNIPIASNIRLADVADVNYSFRKPENINRYNGTETVGLYIKSSAPDLIGISQGLRRVTEKLVNDGYNIEIINDRGAELEKSLLKIIIAIGIGLLTSTLLLFVFCIDLKRLCFLATGQVIIIITAAGISTMLGLSPDSYLLAGFAVGIGMILDSSILITDALKAGFDSYKEIMKPLISSTLSTLTALIPIISLKAEIPGLSILVTSLAIILTASLFLSAAFLPGLYIPNAATKTRRIIFLALLRRKILRLAIRFISIRKSLLIYTVLLAAGIISLTSLHIRIDNPIETSVLFGHIECESGESVQSVDKKLALFTNVISCIDGVNGIQSTSRRGGGDIIVNFDATRTDSFILIDQIKNKARQQGVSLYFPDSYGEKNTKIQIAVTGDDSAELKRICRTALHKILQQSWAVEGVFHFKEDTPAYHFITDPESLYHAGITAAAAAAFLRWNLQGPVAVKWQTTGTEQDLRVMSYNYETLNSIDIASMKMSQSNKASTTVRLDQLGRIIRAQENIRINRLNLQHSESFSVMCLKDDPIKTNEKIWNELEGLTLPDGYSFIPSTKLIRKQSLYRKLWIQFGIAILLIIFILCIERESFFQPLIIIMQLPPILAVPIIILRFIGAELGTETIIGLTLLAGMGINNGILIMNNINNGIKAAVKLRFNGLFLTTVTSVAGMIPLLFTGSTFFINVAIVLISGLTASFYIAVFIFPVILHSFFKP